MKYAIVTGAGVVEVREDSLENLPPTAIQLSDADYINLCNGSHILVNGVIVANPNPQRFP